MNNFDLSGQTRPFSRRGLRLPGTFAFLRRLFSSHELTDSVAITASFLSHSFPYRTDLSHASAKNCRLLLAPLKSSLFESLQRLICRETTGAASRARSER